MRLEFWHWDLFRASDFQFPVVLRRISIVRSEAAVRGSATRHKNREQQREPPAAVACLEVANMRLASGDLQYSALTLNF